MFCFWGGGAKERERVVKGEVVVPKGKKEKKGRVNGICNTVDR